MKKIIMLLVTCFLLTFPSIVSAEYLNQEEFDYANISEWHENGYTGKGVKIVVSDQGQIYTELPAFEGKVFILDEYLKSNSIAFSHAEGVIHVIRQVAPDAEIYASSMWTDGSINDALKISAQIVTRSQSYNSFLSTIDADLSKQAYENGIFLNGSSGNYRDYANAYLKSPYWWSTGAVSMENSYPSRTNYSSYGEGLKSVSFTSLLICRAYDTCGKPGVVASYFSGTSASAPFLSGMVALYYQYYKEQNGVFPSADEVRQFIINNSVDLEEEGYDQFTGHGLFVLPKLNENEQTTDEENVCIIVPEETNKFAVEMIRPDGEIRYVHIDFVSEYINDKGYTLSKCKNDINY